MTWIDTCSQEFESPEVMMEVDVDAEWEFDSFDDGVDRCVSDCVSIIEFVSSSHTGMTQSEISRGTGIPGSSVARYVRPEKIERMTLDRLLRYRKFKGVPGARSIYQNLLEKAVPVAVEDGNIIYEVNMSKYSVLRSIGTWMGYAVYYDANHKKLYAATIKSGWVPRSDEKNVGIASHDLKSIGYFDGTTGNIHYIESEAW